ncbi:hypothetical protein FCI23_39140 [Actinacidiphila oryziradicis]|uniref:Uncharacterized protein n=1 Tax=Actinacidiphila oryziradicis TaxID=2571141 RepID=A0A4U0S008_9ACTN|nr:hypothetical protein FCI23_39140 [Actinacidiphila oryziradicis]
MDRITKHDPRSGRAAAQGPGLPVPHGEGLQSWRTIRVFEPHRARTEEALDEVRDQLPGDWLNDYR